jgi:hypothetical protein
LQAPGLRRSAQYLGSDRVCAPTPASPKFFLTRGVAVAEGDIAIPRVDRCIDLRSD